MIKLDDLERHIILYTKGWYKKTDLIDDLKVIIDRFCSIDVEYLNVDSILYWTQKTYFKVFNKQQIEFQFGYLFYFKKQHTPETFIQFICNRLANITVRIEDELILDLGEPDYNILPRARD